MITMQKIKEMPLLTIIPKFIGLIIMGSIVGCASGNITMIGNPRPSIDPGLVQIYQNKPSKFETIAKICILPEEGLGGALISSLDGEEAAKKFATDWIKRKAAKMGANAISELTIDYYYIGVSSYGTLERKPGERYQYYDNSRGRDVERMSSPERQYCAEAVYVIGDREEALLLASGEGDTVKVKGLLDKGYDVNTRDEYGIPVLLKASSAGHTEVVKLLLEKGANVNVTNRNGETALMQASSAGHTEVVKLLLEKGANVNVTNKNVETALMVATDAGHVNIVELLLKKGANVNLTNGNGRTALMQASSAGRVDIVEILLKKGADMDADKKYTSNDTALNQAARKGHDEVVKLLEPYAKYASEYTDLALYYNKNNDYKKVKENIEKAIKIEPKSFYVWSVQGDIFYKYGDNDNAIIAYKKSVKINPEIGTVWENLAICYVAKKDYKMALDSINKAIELIPNHVMFRATQAEIYLRQGDTQNAGRGYEKALELMGKAIKKDPSATNYINAAWFALLVPKFSDAESYARKGLDLDPEIRIPHLAHTLLFQGKKMEAVAEYRKFIDNYKDNPRDVLKADFSLLKKRYPDKLSLIEWAEKELGRK